MVRYLPMTVRELRAKYLEFFESKGHVRHPSGSLVPYDVTGRLDESLLFNGAGMVQFKPYFRGVAQPPHPRLANAQKCLRTGDIEEVGDDSHLTFFEMLGNFSFGDYFKEEAIAYSWEFLTSGKWLGLDPRRLSFTVFEEDDEAEAHWSKWLRGAGIEPSCRVFRLGEETNYWPAGSFSAGPPGPCGPNTEMFYWVGEGGPPPHEGGYGREAWKADEAAGRWLEIWNDVFIQYEWQGEPLPEGGYQKTGMPPLPFASVDTGMGVERTVVALSGLKSVYETDAFAAVLARIDGLSSRQDERARRIVADHARAAVFCLADGVLPSNTGRGYVLRRLVRRAVLKGARNLGIERPFFHLLVEPLAEAFGAYYAELVEKRAFVEEALRSEEALFRRTLEQGMALLREVAEGLPAGAEVPGREAFRLYDTYGFPLEVTVEMAAEQGRGVGEAEFAAAMAEAQERSRAADARESVYGGVTVVFRFAQGPTPTRFAGYETTRTDSRIVGAVPMADDAGRATAEAGVALDVSPFYAAGGGQVSDIGTIRLVESGEELRVRDVVRQDGVYVHLVDQGVPADVVGMPAAEAAEVLNRRWFDQKVMAEADPEARAATVRHHTATHLLHAALREALGEHVTQAGSLVSPEVLRFDFTHGSALSPDEIGRVEARVNEFALAALPVVTYADVPIAEARAMGAMALFGEKYADRVRVVQVGAMPPTEPSFSRELCGGIHVANTGQIGLFKIVHEGSAAGGVRRITALAGGRAYAWAKETEAHLREAAERLKAPPSDLVGAIERLQDSLREERRKREKLAQAGGQAEAKFEPVGAVEWGVVRAEGLEPADASAMADRLVDGHGSRVALVVNKAGGKLLFVCKAGPGAVAAGAHAGNIVRAAAQAAGGGGGGRPDFASAGGKDTGAADAAVAAARAALG